MEPTGDLFLKANYLIDPSIIEKLQFVVGSLNVLLDEHDLLRYSLDAHRIWTRSETFEGKGKVAAIVRPSDTSKWYN